MAKWTRGMCIAEANAWAAENRAILDKDYSMSDEEFADAMKRLDAESEAHEQEWVESVKQSMREHRFRGVIDSPSKGVVGVLKDAGII